MTWLLLKRRMTTGRDMSVGGVRPPWKRQVSCHATGRRWASRKTKHWGRQATGRKWKRRRLGCWSLGGVKLLVRTNHSEEVSHWKEMVHRDRTNHRQEMYHWEETGSLANRKSQATGKSCASGRRRSTVMRRLTGRSRATRRRQLTWMRQTTRRIWATGRKWATGSCGNLESSSPSSLSFLGPPSVEFEESHSYMAALHPHLLLGKAIKCINAYKS